MSIEKTVLWGVVTILCTLILTIGSCTMHRNHLVEAAIENGADPIAAAYSMRDKYGSDVALYQLTKDNNSLHLTGQNDAPGK